MAKVLSDKQKEQLKDPRFAVALEAVKNLQTKKPSQKSKK